MQWGQAWWAEHPYMLGCRHIYTPMQVLDPLLNSASAQLLWTLSLESSLEKKNHHIEKVGDGWATMQKNFRVLQHGYYRRKGDKRTEMHAQGRQQFPSCPTNTLTQHCLCFSQRYQGFLRGNNEHRVAKEKSKEFQKKVSAHVKTVPAT